MNKRYIDFVPVDKGKVPKTPSRMVAPKTSKAAKPPVIHRSSVSKSPVTPRKPVTRSQKDVPVESFFKEKPLPAGVSTGLKRAPKPTSKPQFGVIEDYQPRRVQKAASISAKNVGPEGPRITKFLNTNKIEKRPLSKSYVKRTMAMTEVKPAVLQTKEPKKDAKPKKTKNSPERIIMKPEKDSRVGMIVAVILTIILGAAAGTVAFLILPK